MRDRWFEAEGLCFSCTQCGKCCARPGVVVFTDEDIARVSAHMNMSPGAFKATYLDWDDGDWMVPVADGEPCLFLEAGLCAIHSVKPVQCRTYPFWPELLESPQVWRDEAEFCEGVGRGEPLSAREIDARTLKE